MSNYLFFDTETTDLPKSKVPPHDPSQPRMMQLAAIQTTEEGEVLEEYSTYIQVGDVPLNKYAFEAHGITLEVANTQGIPPEEAFSKFHLLTSNCEALICHNFSFDIKLIQITSAQIMHIDPEIDLMISDINELPYYCTMHGSKDFCKLPYPSGKKGNKVPKLPELYKILFNKELQGTHDALYDTRATMRCFFELRKLGVM